MTNYWKVFKDCTQPAFSFTYPHLDGKFYLGVIRSYLYSIKFFIKSFLKNVMHSTAGGSSESYRARIKAFYGVYKAYTLVSYLAKIYQKPLKKPDYYFRGYRMSLRVAFFRHLTMFCMKIFILVNQVFSEQSLRIDSHESFFSLWKKIYKKWLDFYYKKKYKARRTLRMRPAFYYAVKLARFNFAVKNFKYFKDLLSFRKERLGYRKILMEYFFAHAESNFKASWPFSYKRKRYRFKYDIFGRRIYLQKKPSFRRKSRKYIRWFRTLVTGGYYFSPAYAQKTFYRGGYGRRAWISRRRARHVFKMKFVFIRYFSKRFGLKNRTAFLRKAEHIARKRGNKWLRYYREFESRLLRVLLLFGFSSSDRMSKSFVSSGSVFINKRPVNDHNYKVIPRVKMGDLVTLSKSAARYYFKKKFRFFKKRLKFFYRGAQAKLVYSLFKKYFSEWTLPSVYSISGPVIKHGLSALMSGPLIRNSKIYYKVNRFIPFFNRVLFKIFVQRFSKKLN